MTETEYTLGPAFQALSGQLNESYPLFFSDSVSRDTVIYLGEEYRGAK